MPEGLPEIPAPFGKKPTRGKKEHEGEFQVPQKSMELMEKEPKYRETRRLNVKETAKSFAKGLGLFIGIEAGLALGGPEEVIIAAPFAASLFKPHPIYIEKKKKVSEVI